jgi:hypothetical protein
MTEGKVLIVHDEDFRGNGRAFMDLSRSTMDVAVVAHVVIYRDRLLKNRYGPTGAIVPGSA